MTLWPVPRALAFLLLAKTLTLVESTDPGSGSNPSDQTTPSSPSNPASEGGSSDKSDDKTLQPISLNIKMKNSSDKCEYQKDDGKKTRTYTTKEGYGFNMIGIRPSYYSGDDHFINNIIWEAKDNKYATKVEIQGIGSKTKTMTLTFAEGSTKSYSKTKENNNWTETSTKDSTESSSTEDSSKPQENVDSTTNVQLDIMSKKETDQYSYTAKDKVATYTAKGSNKITKVYEKCRLGSDKVLWESSTESEYTTKVDIMSDNKVTIYLVDGSAKKFEKTGSFGSKKWTEVTSTEESKNQNLTISN